MALTQTVWRSADDFLLAFSDATERRTGFRRELYPEQRAAVIHNDGPLAIIAGPGTGKTETLVLRTLRLLLVDGLPPQSIVLTTFTEKAARELTDRMARYLQYLSDAAEFAGKDRPDLSQLWTGTLHSLALRLLREYSPAHEGLRVLDDLGAHFLFLKTLKGSDVTSITGDTLYFCLAGKKAETWTTRVKRAKVIREFLARLIEDDVDLDAFWTSCSSIFEPARERLRELFEAYHGAMGATPFRCSLRAGFRHEIRGMRESLPCNHPGFRHSEEAFNYGIPRPHDHTYRSSISTYRGLLGDRASISTLSVLGSCA